MIPVLICITVTAVAVGVTAMVARILADGVTDIFRESANRIATPSVAPSRPETIIVSRSTEAVKDAIEKALNKCESGMAPAGGSSQNAAEDTRLLTLGDHQRLLSGALSSARWRVIIASPQISVGAIKADDIHKQIERAVARGIEVVVLTDHSLNLKTNGVEKAAYLEGRSMLEEAGAQLIVFGGIHFKYLIVDDNLIADGSFNWLSAVRKEGHSHCREERTHVTSGNAATGFIKEELTRMRSLAAISSTRMLRSSEEHASMSKRQYQHNL